MEYELSIFVPMIYKPLEIHFIENNGCCEKNYFVLTSNKIPGEGINYSCQCGCGGWCTTGHRKKEDAINDYIEMCKRYKRRTTK
jgi:hypothetical protein